MGSCCHLNGFLRSNNRDDAAISVVSHCHLSCFLRSSQLFLTVISVVCQAHYGCLIKGLGNFSADIRVFFGSCSADFFCNKLIISALSKTLYFCEKPAQRWSQLREIDSQALFFVSFSNNFLLSWRLILFLPLLFFVCLLPVCLSPCLLASRLLASPSAGFCMQLLCSCPCLVPPSPLPCPVLSLA